MLNLAIMLEDSAQSVPERTAVIAGDTRLTYAQLDAMASSVAARLTERGIGHGDRVALTCPNLPFFPVVYYGVLKAGATVVPLNVLSTAREIAYYLRDSKATAYFCFEGTAELPLAAWAAEAFDQAPDCRELVIMTVDPAAEAPAGQTLTQFIAGAATSFEHVATRETDTAVVLYTSGTTGQPKGAQLSHSNMVQNALVCRRLFGEADHDVHLLTLPLFHSFGQTVQMNCGFASEGTLVLMPRFDPAAALELMVQHEVTFFAGVPTMYWALMNHKGLEDFDVEKIAASLRMAVCGGSSLPLAVIEGFEERFGVPILEGYGLSESSPVATFNRTDRPRRPGSVGFPVWGTQAKVVRPDGSEADVDEPGEIVLRGHHIMTGYLDRPVETAEVLDEAGWFHTGDIGKRDTDGYLYIVDRLKEMIIRNGMNVYPREIEEVLMTHSDVSLVAVIGVAHEAVGEEIKAFVIRTPEGTVTEDELISWAKTQMAAYKYPRVIEFVEELPMTATGKILKRDLVAE